LLRRCLAALAKQTLDSSLYEVIVVEDTGRHGPAAARNRGWRQASAPVVAFTDDDTEPDPDWLRQGLAALADQVDVVSGRLLMPVGKHPTDYERDAQCLEHGEFVTANCFCRKTALEAIGGFDEDFRLAWREDSDLQFRLLQHGARIVRAPGAVVVHPVRPAPWGVSLGQQRKVMFDALLYKKHRRFYRERIRGTPRWDYYAIVAALLGVLAGAAFSLPALLFLSLVTWLGLTATFCAKRLRGTSKRPSHILEVVLTSLAIPPLAVFWRLVGALKFRVVFV
jgi:glycosyltransferase involved in cell wall biosynthesis